MEGIAEIGGGHLATVHILTIALVDDDTIGNLHDAALNALQFITGASQLDEQEEIYHGMTGGLALPYPDGLYENLIEASCLTEDDGLTSLTRHAAQGASRW